MIYCIQFMFLFRLCDARRSSSICDYCIVHVLGTLLSSLAQGKAAGLQRVNMKNETKKRNLRVQIVNWKMRGTL